MTTEARRVLLLSGSTRAGSTNTAVLRALASMAPPRVTAVLYAGLSELSAFNPDDSASGQPAVDALLHDIRAADAVVICTPEYAGSLPGSFKNLLDWTVGGGELYGKPVAWVNAANPGRGGGAMAELDVVLGYVGAEIVEERLRPGDCRPQRDRQQRDHRRPDRAGRHRGDLDGADGLPGRAPIGHVNTAGSLDALHRCAADCFSGRPHLCTAPACRGRGSAWRRPPA